MGYLQQCQAILVAGKLVLGQPVPGSGSSQGGTSCSAMAVSNNLLFVADNRGVIYTWRCNIKNGILQVKVTYCYAATHAVTPAKCLFLLVCVSIKLPKQEEGVSKYTRFEGLNDSYHTHRTNCCVSAFAREHSSLVATHVVKWGGTA